MQFKEVQEMSLKSRFFILLFLLVALTGVSHAQFSGTITGEVDDPNGSVVPNAKLTLTKVDTGDLRTVTSNSSGLYQFVSLPPGQYRLETTAGGFATAQSSFTLETGQTMKLPVQPAGGNATP